MSVTVICHGCGQSFPTGADYRRNKIQCPACGVICPVPQGQDTSPAPRPARKESAPVSGSQEEEIFELLRADAPERKPARQERPRNRVESKLPESPLDGPGEVPTRPVPKPELLFTCRRCGLKVRRQGECPDCNAAPPPVIDPDAPVEPAPQPRETRSPRWMELDDAPPPAAVAEDEDDTPYILADRDEARCPDCNKVMPEDGVVCVACGFDLRKRKKVAKTYEPIARVWETNLSWTQRVVTWLVSLAAVLLLGGGSVLAAGLPLFPFFASWLAFAAFFAFLLGTFERVELTRDRKGKVVLTQTWRYCFVPVRPVVTPVRGFGSISTTKEQGAGLWEWLIFLWLLPVGLVGAAFWWYHVIHKLSYSVALTRDHGYPVHYAYRGRSEEQMQDIAGTLRNATGLPWDV